MLAAAGDFLYFLRLLPEEVNEARSVATIDPKEAGEMNRQLI